MPSITTMAVIVQQKPVWEVWDNYQKQTFRNRCYVCTDRGRHLLNIPIRHVGGEQGRQRTRDVRIDNSYPWQRLHWRTLQTSYRTSPFFEFYEDSIADIYHRKFDFLLDFNLKTMALTADLMELALPDGQTDKFELEPPAYRDLRGLVNAKKHWPLPYEPYTQVFHDRHGFVADLSVLDLLFNEGTNALHYLENLNLTDLHA